jgi:hypothetical protein
MKRWSMVLCLLALLGAGTIWLWRGPLVESLPLVALSDGSCARIVEVALGPHRLPQPSTGLVARAIAKVSGILPRQLAQSMPAASFSGGGASWTHVPEDTNSLRVWLEVALGSSVATLKNGELLATITDADGWRWQSHARGNSSKKGWGTNLLEYLAVGFSSFPRWQELLEVEFAFHSYAGADLPLGGTRLRNPAYGLSPAQWTVQPLPQTASAGDLSVTLQGIRFNRSSAPGEEDEGGQPVPYANLRLQIVEHGEGVPLSNVWHRVVTSYYDNYGNNSYSGLPPRRPGDTNVPPIQWKIGLLLVGDHRSRSGSNTFVTVTNVALPGPGGLIRFEAPEARLAGLRLHSAAIVGAGVTRFLQGQVTTNWVSANLPSYLSREWTASGKDRVTTYKCAVPMLVMACDGPVEGIWFSCRATNPENGETVWLQGDPNRNAKEPRFERLYDDQDFIAFMCSDLATNVAWQFTVGVHAPRQVEFYLDRPEWDGGRTSGGKMGGS